MHSSRTALFAALALAGSLTACGRKDQAAEQASQTTTPTTAPATEPASPTPSTAATGATTEATTAAPATFDLSKVPVSNANLGRFPYLSSIKNYRIKHDEDSVGVDFDRSYVYDGKNLVPVEGKVVRRAYQAIDEKKQASPLLIQRNYEELVKSLGGVKISSARVSDETIEKFGKAEYEKHRGHLYGGDVDTYVIRQEDKEVWVQVQAQESGYPDGYRYLLYVTERAAMPQQAGLLKADDLKKN